MPTEAQRHANRFVAESLIMPTRRRWSHEIDMAYLDLDRRLTRERIAQARDAATTAAARELERMVTTRETMQRLNEAFERHVNQLWSSRHQPDTVHFRGTSMWTAKPRPRVDQNRTLRETYLLGQGRVPARLALKIALQRKQRQVRNWVGLPGADPKRRGL